MPIRYYLVDMSDTTKNKLSKEEIRAARLKAMGIVESTQNESPEGQTTFLGDHVHKKECEGSSFVKRPLTSSECQGIKNVLYYGGGATEEDLRRWYNQGFEFCNEPTFGLKQGHGGPCGVLAAVLAEMIIDILLKDSTLHDMNAAMNMSRKDLEYALVDACVRIFLRASNEGHVCVIECSQFCCFLNPSPAGDGPVIYEFNTKAEAIRFLHEHRTLLWSQCGCVNVLMSLVMTRCAKVVIYANL